MNLPRKIAANSGVLLAGRIATSAISLLVSIWLIRYLGSIGYGRYSVVFAYLTFFRILTALGVDPIIIREISKGNARKNVLIGNAILMKMSFSLIAVLSACVVAQFMGYGSEIKLLIYVASFSMLLSFGRVYVDIFQANLKIVWYTIAELAVTLLFSGLTLMVIAMKGSLLHFVLLQTVRIVPLTVAYFHFSRRIADSRPVFTLDFSVWKSLTRSAMPIFLSGLFGSINLRIDQVMLFNMLGEKNLGFYSSIVRITESVNLMPGVLMVSIFPVLSTAFVQSNERFSKIYNLSFKYMGMIILPVAFGTTLLSGRLITIVYGTEFLPAATAFAILIWSAVFVFLGTVNFNILVASDLQRYILLFSALGASSNVVLNLILIPRYGIVGASLATVISYSVVGLVPQYLIKKTRQITKDYIKATLRPLLCSAVMSIGILCFYSLNTFVLIALSAAVYFALLLLTKALDEHDFRYFRQIARRRSET
ncbi:MAG: flippase [Candidatus Eisenbacteria bacterium]